MRMSRKYAEIIRYEMNRVYEKGVVAKVEK